MIIVYLKKFSETGNNQALHFKEQNLVDQAISLGSLIFYDKKFNGNTSGKSIPAIASPPTIFNSTSTSSIG